MPLAKKIGYIPSSINFVNKNFENIKGYIDLVELQISHLMVNDFERVVRRYISEKDVKGFLDTGGAFNFSLILPDENNNQKLSNSCSHESYFSQFIKVFSESRSLFNDIIQNIILPIPLDYLVSTDKLKQNSLISFLKDISINSPDLWGKILFDYQMKSRDFTGKQYFKTIKDFEIKIGDTNSIIPSCCFNIPHLYDLMGKNELLFLFRAIRDSGSKIKEFYIADIVPQQKTEKMKYLPVGSGKISWYPFLTFFKKSDLIFLVNGDIKPIKQSFAHLGDITIKRRTKTNGNGIISGFFFTRGKKSFFQSSPGTKLALKYLLTEKLDVNSILDLGCGNGRNSYYLARNTGAKTHLIDVDRDLLNYTKAFFEIFDTPSPDIDIMDLENPDITVFDRKYDVVLLSYVMQNINPSSYFQLMELCRKKTRRIFIFEIYVNKQVYPEECVTKRGETSWYGFSREEVFELFESFFDILAWKIKKGKKNPLIISLVGLPKINVIKPKEINFKYKNVPIIDYNTIKVRTEKEKSLPKKKKINFKEFDDSPYWLKLSSHLLATGVNNNQLDILQKKLKLTIPRNNIVAPNYLGASILLVARAEKIPIHLQELVKVLETSRKELYSALKKIQKKKKLRSTPPSLYPFFDRYLTVLELKKLINRPVKDILNEITSKYDCKTLGLPHISGLVLALNVSRSLGTPIDPNKIAKTLHISPSTIRTKLKSLEAIRIK